MEAEAGRRRVAIQPPAFLPGLLYIPQGCVRCTWLSLALPSFLVPRVLVAALTAKAAAVGKGRGGSPPASETLTHSGDGQGAEMTKGRICGSAAPGRRAAPLFQPHPHRWGPVVLRHW